MLSINEIAKNRIYNLFKKSHEIYKTDMKLANRYVELARKIAMKTQTSIPSNLKKKFCKKCKSYLVPGLNCRISIRNKKIIYYCKECKNYMRYPYKPKRKIN